MSLQDQVNDVTKGRNLSLHKAPLKELLLGDDWLVMEDIPQNLDQEIVKMKRHDLWKIKIGALMLFSAVNFVAYILF